MTPQIPSFKFLVTTVLCLAIPQWTAYAAPTYSPDAASHPRSYETTDINAHYARSVFPPPAAPKNRPMTAAVATMKDFCKTLFDMTTPDQEWLDKQEADYRLTKSEAPTVLLRELVSGDLSILVYCAMLYPAERDEHISGKEQSPSSSPPPTMEHPSVESSGEGELVSTTGAGNGKTSLPHTGGGPPLLI